MSRPIAVQVVPPNSSLPRGPIISIGPTWVAETPPRGRSLCYMETIAADILISRSPYSVIGTYELLIIPCDLGKLLTKTNKSLAIKTISRGI